jgi:DNA adenine methylase
LNLQPVIKWTGSKRHQAEAIIKHIPDKEYEIYYEPFVGGGSMLYRLLHSKIKFKGWICSDKCEPLINLWLLIKQDPEYLTNYYKDTWTELQEKGQSVYYNVREDFNRQQKPEQLFFLTRTCTNGLIRFNTAGQFNTSFHITRPGIHPDTISGIINQWSKKLQEFDVQFLCCDYKEIKPNESDLVYLDPPYMGTSGMYYGAIDHQALWDYLKGLKCTYLLSYDGQSGGTDNTYKVPTELYEKHVYINSGGSSFKRIVSREIAEVRDSLYIKYNISSANNK